MSKFWHERTNETEHCWMHSFASRARRATISIEKSSVSNLVLSTGSNHYVIHVPAHSYAHPIHVTRTCKKPSFPFTGNLWISVRRERRTPKVKEIKPTGASAFFRGIGKRKSGVRSEVNGNMSPCFNLMRVLFPLESLPAELH